MRLPKLTELATAKDNTEVFTGYNHNLRNSVGEWYDQKNMTTDYYPVASPRHKRSVQAIAKETVVPISADENGIYSYIKSAGCKGMAFTDNNIITIQDFYDQDNKKLGSWFTSNGNLVALNKSAPVLEVKNIHIESDIDYRGFSHFIHRYYELFKLTGSELNDFDISINDIISFHLFENGERIFTKSNKFKVIEISDAYWKLESAEHLEEYVTWWPDEMEYIPLNTDCNILFINETKAYKLRRCLSYFDLSSEKKNIMRIGSYICVFPDGVIYETENKKEAVPVFKIAKSIENVSFTLKTVLPDLKEEIGYKIIEKFNDSTEGNDNYRLSDGQIQYYIPDTNMWTFQKTNVMICSEGGTDGVFEGFNIGDVLTMSLTSDSFMNPLLNEKFYGLLDYDQETNKFAEKSLKIIEKGSFIESHGWKSEYIIVDGFVAWEYTENEENHILPYYTAGENSISFVRKVPKFALACESQNRIWCCSNNGHEIYASALGNPYNFYDYSGIATDSYAVNVGTDGEFTGCINFQGKPLFFKENCLHHISGSYPSNDGIIDSMSYAVTTITDFKGVEKGSEKSLVVIDNILYYKSSAGVVAYDGATTTIISKVLGKEKYKNAVAGEYRNKYYISMQDKYGIYHLFVFDTTLGVWSQEDNTQINQFLKVKNELLYLSENSDDICCVSDENVLELEEYEKEEDFEWECETGNFGYSYPNNKYLSRLQVRLKIADKAKASIYVQYNSDGTWHRKGEMSGRGIKTHLIPIVPVRCDHMKIKIAGKGDVKIYSVSKIFEEGGDV